MNKPAPFQVTPRVLDAIASLLRQHPGMQPVLMMHPSFESLDDGGSVKTRFRFESFWIAHDTPDKFSGWPKVDLCGETIPIEPRALERLAGKTLRMEAREVVIEGEEETLEFFVAA